MTLGKILFGLGSMPYGFIADSHCMFSKDRDGRELAVKIGKAIDSEPKLKRKFRQGLISTFSASTGFMASIVAAEMIVELEGHQQTRLDLPLPQMITFQRSRRGGTGYTR